MRQTPGWLIRIGAFFRRPWLCLAVVCALALLTLPFVWRHFASVDTPLSAAPSPSSAWKAQAPVPAQAAPTAPSATAPVQTPAPAVQTPVPKSGRARFFAFAGEYPLYSLDDAAAHAQALLTAYHEDARLVSVRETAFSSAPVLALDFTLDGRQHTAWVTEGGAGFGCRLAMYPQSDLPPEELSAAFASPAEGEESHALLESSELSVCFLYRPDLLREAPIPKPADDTGVAACTLRLSETAFCLVEDASGYAGSKKGALDACMRQLTDFYPGGETSADSYQSLADNAYTLRRYSHRFAGEARALTAACIKLENGRLISVLVYSPAEGPMAKDAQRLFEDILRSLRPLRS